MDVLPIGTTCFDRPRGIIESRKTRKTKGKQKVCQKSSERNHREGTKVVTSRTRVKP